MDYSRHNSWFQAMEFPHPITIIGAGATGSRVFEALINLGLRNITVYDFDKVEEHNLANQIFDSGDIGETKVRALNNWHYVKTGEREIASLKYNNTKVIGNMRKDIQGIVFLLTDTMESRKEILDNSLKYNAKVPLVIETRMALTHGNIYCFNPNNVNQTRQWENTLIPDETAEVSACGTALSVGTTANIIANLAVNQMIQYHLHPDAMDDVINIFLQPLITDTTTWKRMAQVA